ncbi:hypothetical protein J6590_007109 [Homalodisca vitripennis]|nr:hypothetical protein J6590_007109 [Homalodisca vitripennis]
MCLGLQHGIPLNAVSSHWQTRNSRQARDSNSFPPMNYSHINTNISHILCLGHQACPLSTLQLQHCRCATAVMPFHQQTTQQWHGMRLSPLLLLSGESVRLSVLIIITIPQDVGNICHQLIFFVASVQSLVWL